jgi:holin-like protein
MKLLLQIGVIFGLFWLSQGIEKVLPFSFPASVISMILLLVLLCTGVIKLKHIHETTDFVLTNLAFFFVPVTVTIVNYVDLIMENGVAFLVICVVSTVVTFAATAWAVQLTNRLMNRNKEEQE